MAYATPFSIPFQAPMSSAQVSWLREELGLTIHPKTAIADLPFAFGLLDRFSGFYLLKGEGDRWTLECRTYEEPTPEQVASWRARAEWVVAALPRR
ncbi:MAG TPA: hypothetical protein VFN89_07775 [Solirubrobacterales bacterium]|nr:hypothetical protein [Solirubrobacterales bacterium]